MVGNEFVAPTFQLGDLFAQRRHPSGKIAGLGGTCLQHGWIRGRRDRGADGVDTLPEEFVAAMVLAEEGAQSAVVTALQVLEIEDGRIVGFTFFLDTDAIFPLWGLPLHLDPED